MFYFSTLKLSSNVVGDSNDENNLPHKCLLTSKQFLRLCKAFENNYSTNIKLSKTRFCKIGQSEEFLGRILEFLGSLLNTGLPLTKIVLKPLAKSV